MNNIKAQILSEIDRRMADLQQHHYDEMIVPGNQYYELNQALEKVISIPLMNELSSLKEYVKEIK